MQSIFVLAFIGVIAALALMKKGQQEMLLALAWIVLGGSVLYSFIKLLLSL